MKTERYIYSGGSSVREYLGYGDDYLELYNHGSAQEFADNLYNHVSIHCWHCKDSTMKRWGRRITLQEACVIIPDYQERFRLCEEKYRQHKEEQAKVDDRVRASLSQYLRENILQSASDEELQSELLRRQTKAIKKSHNDHETVFPARASMRWQGPHLVPEVEEEEG